MKNSLKHFLRILISGVVGYFTIRYFKIDSNALSILYYFAVYIAVSLLIEMIWREVESFKKQGQKNKPARKK